MLSSLDGAEGLDMIVVPIVPKIVLTVVLSHGSGHLLRRSVHLGKIHTREAKPVKIVVDQRPLG